MYLIRNLVILIVIVAVIVGVVGFYLDWFHVSTGNGDHNANLNISVNKDRIQQDENKAKQTLENLGHKIEGKKEQVVGRGPEHGNSAQTWEADFESRIKAFDAKVGELQGKATHLDPAKRAELSRDMDQLNQKRREINRKFQELKTATGKTADDLKADIDADLKELRKDYDKIAARFE